MTSLTDFRDACVISDHVQAVISPGTYPAPLPDLFPETMVQEAQDEIVAWPGYAPTPLHSLAPLAEALNIATLHYKDESGRFGLGSFKALGGAYAVIKTISGLIGQSTGTKPALSEVRSGNLAAQTAEITVATATDGNHGRSVAWGAQLAGCNCVIYIHSEVSKGREEAMAAFGAKVVRVDGDYDHSVRQCAEDAASNGWHIISDTSWEGYMDTPRYVMAGYTVMVREILEQEKLLPTHIFIQAGVGGLAAAITAAFWQHAGEQLPRIVIVESEHADCLIESARSGSAATVEVEEETIMAGLSCGEASPLAWEILSRSASDFLTLPDTQVPPGMRLLANGEAGPKIEAGECGLPGIIALAAATGDPKLRQQLALDESSRVLVFGCEGATDLEIYDRIMRGENA